MKQCWASILGDCGDEISKEHLVSASLWETRSIYAKGFPWCREEMKAFGINSLASKILCKHHNNALSPLDTAAGIAFDALRRSAEIGNERQASSSTEWPVVELVVSEARLLERWFLKTVLNLTTLDPGSILWRQTGLSLAEPPELLVRMAFGLETIREPYGLYAAVTVGEQILMHDSFVFSPLMYDGSQMVGAMVEFRGLRFVLHLESLPLPETLELPAAKIERWRTGDLLFRLRGANFVVKGRHSHVVRFDWSA